MDDEHHLKNGYQGLINTVKFILQNPCFFIYIVSVSFFERWHLKTKIMITIKIFAFFGLAYLMIGIFNYKIEWVDRLYFKNWGFEPPTRKETIRLGINCIVVEILIDLFINCLI